MVHVDGDVVAVVVVVVAGGEVELLLLAAAAAAADGDDGDGAYVSCYCPLQRRRRRRRRRSPRYVGTWTAGLEKSLTVPRVCLSENTVAVWAGGTSYVRAGERGQP